MPGLDAEVTFHEEIYAGGPSEVLELLHGSEDRHPVVMVVGHEPTVASLVAKLADEESDAGSIAQARIGLPTGAMRSEEHTSELQSRGHIVCRLLLEKKKKR